ncbi:DNA photolyase [bacterium]|nr:DNA photolyase [bacterium]MCP5462117.1 DNA photolyase [bacterium]
MKTQYPYNPNRLVIEESALNAAFTQKILSAFPDVPKQIVGQVNEIKKSGHSQYKKKEFIITDYKGDMIKTCPGCVGTVNCNYLVANIVQGCPFGCTYCFLQDYMNSGSIVICGNLEKFFEQLTQVQRNGFLVRLGTGELADSLAFDPILGLTDEIIPHLKNVPNVIMEFKTKSNYVENLLKHDGSEQIVIGWSVNPQIIINHDERGTASLDERIEAARKAANHGYSVAFHFDPIIMINDWESHYIDVVNKIFAAIPAYKIAWISMGVLRITPSLKSIIQERYQNSKLLAYGEFTMSQDGKFRYFRPLRVKLYRTILNAIRSYSTKVPVYCCMETDQVWQEVFNAQPSEQSELSLIFDRNTVYAGSCQES